MRLTLLVALGISACGCTAQYRAGKALADRPTLSGVTVTIQTPGDGADMRPKTYVGSGRQTADAIATALTKRGAIIDVAGASAASPARPYAFYSNQFVAPSTAGTYRITPTIELWSDRVTEWSGIPDQIKIRMVVTDTAGKIVDDREVTATSKWATFGGDHPQQMLVDLFGKWANTAFAPPAKK